MEMSADSCARKRAAHRELMDSGLARRLKTASSPCPAAPIKRWLRGSYSIMPASVEKTRPDLALMYIRIQGPIDGTEALGSSVGPTRSRWLVFSDPGRFSGQRSYQLPVQASRRAVVNVFDVSRALQPAVAQAPL
jgi:hypothetical protein